MVFDSRWVRLVSALVCAQILLGGYSVFGKFGIYWLDPVWFALIREWCAGLILLLLAYFWEIKPKLADRILYGIPSVDLPSFSPVWPTYSDLPRFILIAMTGIFGNQLFFILGLASSPSNTAALIQPLAPIWTVIFAIALRMESVTSAKIFGVGIAVFGSLITLGIFNFDFANFSLGSIFFILNTACMGSYFLLQKPMLSKYPPITTTAVAYVIGAMMMTVAAILFRSAGNLSPLTLEGLKGSIWPLLYTIVGPSIGAYLLVAYANSRLDSTTVSASKTLQPLFACLLSYFILEESLHLHQAIGAPFLIAGVLLLARETVKTPPIAVPPSAKGRIV